MNEFDHVKKIYNRIARAYEEKRKNPADSTWNDFLERPAMEAMLKPLVNNKAVLDLGSGSGLLTKEIIEWGGTACGVDLSDEMIAIARENYPEIDFSVAQSDKLPYENKKFDLVASSLVMHYIQKLSPTFSEIARVLKDDGQFVFSMHHPLQESFNVDKAKVDGQPIMQPYFHNDAYYWKMCGVELLSFHHTFENIIKSLKSAGFVLYDMYECRPDKSTKDIFADFEHTSNFPTFCVFHALIK